ncbi:MAG: hypothetical protein J0665_19705 [Deltaproteobacteria bacterium]|nr:hypothetical protein [Deltaproteobacteria bacterium]
MNFKKAVTIAAAAGALAALAVPAMAEMTPYGSMRFQTFYRTADPVVGSSDTDLTWDLAANARLGVKGTTGNIGGVVEMGFVSGDLKTRLMYGTYKTSLGTLLIGQDYSNNWMTSAQVDLNDKGFSGYGALDNSRQPQVKFTMNNGLYFAGIKPTVAATTTTTDYDSILPELNVGYKGKAGNFDYNAGVLFQTFDYKTATLDETVNSYLVYFGGKMAAGPASLQFNLGYGQNTGDMSIARDARSLTTALPLVTNKFIVASAADTTSIEGFIQAGYKLSDMVSLYAGVGYAADDSDVYADADDKMAFFVNAPITVAKGFTVVPEFSYYDQMKNSAGADERTDYSVGAKLQMDF